MKPLCPFGFLPWLIYDGYTRTIHETIMSFRTLLNMWELHYESIARMRASDSYTFSKGFHTDGWLYDSFQYSDSLSSSSILVKDKLCLNCLFKWYYVWCIAFEDYWTQTSASETVAMCSRLGYITISLCSWTTVFLSYRPTNGKWRLEFCIHPDSRSADKTFRAYKKVDYLLLNSCSSLDVL